MNNPSNAEREGGVAGKNEKARRSTSERPPPAPGHETVVAPFGDIIDVILEANPEAIRRLRRKRKESVKKR